MPSDICHFVPEDTFRGRHCRIGVVLHAIMDMYAVGGADDYTFGQNGAPCLRGEQAAEICVCDKKRSNYKHLYEGDKEPA